MALRLVSNDMVEVKPNGIIEQIGFLRGSTDRLMMALSAEDVQRVTFLRSEVINRVGQLQIALDLVADETARRMYTAVIDQALDRLAVLLDRADVVAPRRFRFAGEKR